MGVGGPAFYQDSPPLCCSLLGRKELGMTEPLRTAALKKRQPFETLWIDLKDTVLTEIS